MFSTPKMYDWDFVDDGNEKGELAMAVEKEKKS
jgi:hypothetical protein